MSIRLRQINNEYVRRIPIPSALDTRKVRGGNLIPDIYSNVFLAAKKKSGKTSTIFTIMKKCCDKNCKIIIFCSTLFKDENWIEIVKYFEKKGNDMQLFTSIYEDGIDQLTKIVDELGQQDEEKEDKQIGPPTPELDRCDEILDKLNKMHQAATGRLSAEELVQIREQEDKDEQEKHKKKHKSKYKCQEYMIIFDDLSNELKSTSLLALMKKNRHYKSKLLISSQWINDLLPASRKQVDLIILFGGFSEAKVKEIYKDADSSIPFEKFYAMYKQATEKPYSFMWIDTRTDTIRQNFSHLFLTDKKLNIS
jgi:hypothetical protein